MEKSSLQSGIIIITILAKTEYKYLHSFSIQFFSFYNWNSLYKFRESKVDGLDVDDFIIKQVFYESKDQT